MTDAQIDRKMRELTNHIRVLARYREDFALQGVTRGLALVDKAIQDHTQRLELLNITRKLLA